MIRQVMMTGNVPGSPDRKYVSSISAPLGMSYQRVAERVAKYEGAFENVHATVRIY